MRKFRMSLKGRPSSSGAVGNRFFADTSRRKSGTPERAAQTGTTGLVLKEGATYLVLRTSRR